VITRLTTLYRRWRKQGDGVFDDASSQVLADALASGSGRVEYYVLPSRTAISPR
jgi:hypothetical protein